MNQINQPLTLPEPAARLLPDIFFSRAEKSPDSIAAIFEGTSLTYREMADKVEAMARGLVAAGVKPGQFVGLWMTRSLDLQMALLAILRAGAAYLPFDQAAPPERVAICLNDAEAAALVVDHATESRIGNIVQPVLAAATLARHDGTPLPVLDSAVQPENPAYLIYTSGSTGVPKGVVISHRNICHYLAASQTLYRLSADDIVFQGASVAFDLSLEEIFLPYLVGARLWIATQDVLQDTESLAARMSVAGITVLDTVPTLLALLQDDVPSLRVVILGGEACPPALAAKWCRPGRHLFNSYGPTETTVVATAIEIHPDDPITIGRALPGYTTHVVDENLHKVAPGTEGELLIGGPGVASGYWRRDELTSQKFIANPFGADGIDPVLYRTGDAVVEDEEGRLVFRGRIDDQVKIRGFRVELGEIEARLGEQPGIVQAALVLRREGEMDRLVAFIKLAPGAAMNQEAWRRALAETMPPYMIPSHFQPIAELPTLTSGKLDRKALALLPLEALAAADEADEAPATEIEAALLAAAKPLLPGQSIRFDADFFLDLGGHSLIAARFVSAVRKNPALAGLTIQDVYAARTLRSMAALLATRKAPPRAEAFPAPPLLRRFLCGLAQLLCLPFILALTTAPWLAVFVVYQLFTGEEHNFVREAEVVTLTYAGINVASSAFAIAAKWLIMGRTRPGIYPLWGFYYFRWWLSRQLLGMIHLTWFKGTPVLRLLLRLLGARVGRDAMISDFEAGAIDLLEIGAGTAFGSKVQFANAEVIGDKLVIGRISVGDHAVIGSSCVLGQGSSVGTGTELIDLTALSAGAATGDWEIWEGSPARPSGRHDPADMPAPPAPTDALRLAHFGIYAICLAILPAVTLIPIIPALHTLDSLGDWLAETMPFLPDMLILPLVAWPAAMALILATAMLVAVLRWTLLPSVKAGRYSVHGNFYIRKWIVALATELTLETLSSLFATVYMRNWYRLLGARIGKDSEISANLGGSYDLVEIGAKSFIADEVSISDEDIRHGWMLLEPMRTADRVFVGNSAVMTPGCDLPEGTLIGIKSRPPARDVPMAENGIWFGSPPILLPLRQRFDMEQAWTFEPSWRRRVGRAVFEAFSVSFPSMIAITLGSRAVDYLAPAILAHDVGRLVLQFTLCATLIALGMLVAAVVFKWAMIGAYKPTMKPMWSWWAIRTESVAVNYFGLAGAVLLDHLRGTPFLPMAFRLFGAKFGRGVYMDSVDITEFDCIEVGDYAAINFDGDMQTHLYEDRVMKIGRVRLGAGVTVGSGTTVLYDTRIGDYARLGPLTIVMKGEEIPPQSHWQGAPAQPI